LAAGLFSSCSRRPVYTSVAPTQAYGSVYNQPYAPGATVNRNYNVPRQLSIDSIDQSIDGLKLQQAAIKEDLKAGNIDEQNAIERHQGQHQTSQATEAGAEESRKTGEAKSKGRQTSDSGTEPTGPGTQKSRKKSFADEESQ
jgi:hypothetical protein